MEAGKAEDQRRIEYIYLVLSDLRYILHREANTLEDYQKMSLEHYSRVATAARMAGEMIPEERLRQLDEE